MQDTFTISREKLLLSLNTCKNPSIAKAICDLFELPYDVIKPCIIVQSIDLFIKDKKDKNFHMVKIKSAYQDYVHFCEENDYYIESQYKFTRAIKSKFGCFTKGQYFMTKEESSLESVEAFVSANEIHIEDYAVCFVYDEYIRFCHENNYRAASLTQFGRNMNKLGYTTYQRWVAGNKFNFYKKI